MDAHGFAAKMQGPLLLALEEAPFPLMIHFLLPNSSTCAKN